MKFDKKIIYRLSRPYILAIGLLLISYTSFAQPKTNDFLLGGSLSIFNDNGKTPQNQEVTNATFTGFTFEPSISFFVSKRIAVGFSSLIDYEGSEYTYKLAILNDSVDKTISFKSNTYSLSYSFGINGSYFLPLGNNFYFKNTLDCQWGNKVTGDKVATFFSVDKPQQDRINFINARYLASLTYFMKPQLSVSFGINPISYKLETNKKVRTNQADVYNREHKFGLQTNATGFFITLNYLIISDDSN